MIDKKVLIDDKVDLSEQTPMEKCLDYSKGIDFFMRCCPSSEFFEKYLGAASSFLQDLKDQHRNPFAIDFLSEKIQEGLDSLG